jgi:hypothetical protein
LRQPPWRSAAPAPGHAGAGSRQLLVERHEDPRPCFATEVGIELLELLRPFSANAVGRHPPSHVLLAGLTDEEAPGSGSDDGGGLLVEDRVENDGQKRGVHILHELGIGLAHRSSFMLRSDRSLLMGPPGPGTPATFESSPDARVE